jgi:ATP-grasp domain
LLHKTEAGDFLDRSRIGRMIAGARGGVLDRDGVIRALCEVSRLGAASAEITAIDVNPAIVSGT